MMGVRASNDEGAEITWNWINANFERVRQRLAKASPSLLSSVVQSCSSGGITVTRAEEIHKAFGTIPSLSRTVANLVESTKATAAFVVRSKTTKAGSSDGFWNRLNSEWNM